LIEKKFENIKVLNNFFNHVTSRKIEVSLRYCDPFVVALVDRIEDTIVLDPLEDSDF